MSQAVSRRPLTAESRFRSQASLCETCSAQSDSGTGFSPSTSIFSCQCNSTYAPYSFSSTWC